MTQEAAMRTNRPEPGRGGRRRGGHAHYPVAEVVSDRAQLGAYFPQSVWPPVQIDYEHHVELIEHIERSVRGGASRSGCKNQSIASAAASPTAAATAV